MSDNNDVWKRMMDKAGVAAVLSFLIPGLGQFYNGEFWRGIFWIVITTGSWIGSAGTLGWICHIIAAYTAYHRAKKRLPVSEETRIGNYTDNNQQQIP